MQTSNNPPLAISIVHFALLMSFLRIRPLPRPRATSRNKLNQLFVGKYIRKLSKKLYSVVCEAGYETIRFEILRFDIFRLYTEDDICLMDSITSKSLAPDV
jgi:hypothetical protein